MGLLVDDGVIVGIVGTNSAVGVLEGGVDMVGNTEGNAEGGVVTLDIKGPAVGNIEDALRKEGDSVGVFFEHSRCYVMRHFPTRLLGTLS